MGLIQMSTEMPGRVSKPSWKAGCGESRTSGLERGKGREALPIATSRCEKRIKEKAGHHGGPVRACQMENAPNSPATG